MMIIVSALFLIAISLSAMAIFGTIANNMPRIIEIIENRDNPVLRSRTIHIGAMRGTAGNLPVAAAYAPPRLVVINSGYVSGHADAAILALPLAA